ncbi:uncharacterized protein LOC112455493 isoform X2 [Temnothorax curvispinosus]|uniref:Uncharacterized protein LOC112455493 isoform X2 n=1 Tax=Temnothorax curvispinosus TaxID=300111 RepID=A0A6J1PTM2_9HYME|nr:uncharacterized protein LOC112455493 isoform X2 [Temnothorax curvispinosus]
MMRRSGMNGRGVGDNGEGALVLLLVALTPVICSAGILDPWQWARSDRIEVNIPWLPFENETRCYDELGCLNITRSWYHLIHRPLNVFPLPREVINTRFILYTHKNPLDVSSTFRRINILFGRRQSDGTGERLESAFRVLARNAKVKPG